MKGKQPQKIFFDEEDQKFLNDYKETTGVTIQKFVTDAVKEKIMRMDTQQTIEDLELTSKPYKN